MEKETKANNDVLLTFLCRRFLLHAIVRRRLKYVLFLSAVLDSVHLFICENKICLFVA